MDDIHAFRDWPNEFFIRPSVSLEIRPVHPENSITFREAAGHIPLITLVTGLASLSEKTGALLSDLPDSRRPCMGCCLRCSHRTIISVFIRATRDRRFDRLKVRQLRR